MKREMNPFLLIALAAANNKGVFLSSAQCKKLMKNDNVFSEAVNCIPLKKWDTVMGGASEIRFLREFAKFGELNAEISPRMAREK